MFKYYVLCYKRKHGAFILRKLNDLQINWTYLRSIFKLC